MRSPLLRKRLVEVTPRVRACPPAQRHQGARGWGQGDLVPFEEGTDLLRARQLISERSVTVMISNHTYSNLVLRPPAIASTGLAIDDAAPCNADADPDTVDPTITLLG